MGGRPERTSWLVRLGTSRYQELMTDHEWEVLFRSPAKPLEPPVYQPLTTRVELPVAREPEVLSVQNLQTSVNEAEWSITHTRSLKLPKLRADVIHRGRAGLVPVGARADMSPLHKASVRTGPEPTEPDPELCSAGKHAAVA